MSAVLVLFLAQIAAAPAATPVQRMPPVLDFPEPGMDDSAAYEGYRTRFYRDAAGNTVQIFIKGQDGRVVALLANGANESVGFTARDSAGRPARLEWGAREAVTSSEGGSRSIEFVLRTELSRVDLGWFMLGTMRLERDLMYQGRHLRPFDAPPFPRPELDTLVATLARLGDTARQRHLEVLRVADLDELRARLTPAITRAEVDTSWIVLVQQPSFDGRNHLAVELRVNRLTAHVQTGPRAVTVRSRGGGPLTLAVRVATSADPLTPLAREELFNSEFERFLSEQRAMAEGGQDSSAILRYRWLDRQVRGLELVSSREKLMAGLPNFATYFGRDMLMSSLMMEPILSGGMLEHVIASVLRKLSPEGEVSHEEALGGQAIRENAVIYNEHMATYFRHQRAGRRARADTALAQALEVLAGLDDVRENYSMLDDDFQFPIVVARYLEDPRVSAERKRAFLRERAVADDTTSRLTRLLRNLAYVARTAAPYADRPIATNLVAFPRRPNGTYHPGSWRDSNAGYGNGRFAMDINAIWVPEALGACARIIRALSTVSDTPPPLPEAMFDRLAQAWRDASRHFVVRLTPATVRANVRARLVALPAAERAYWNAVLASTPPVTDTLEFLALSLDATGRPIRVVNTDPATALFLQDLPVDQVRRDLEIVMRRYPVGLFISGLGPVVANDAYATPRIWEAFRRDQYHSPRVVWGREVNLLLLALAKEATRATDEALRAVADTALRHVLDAVEASGLSHNELWSYRITNGQLMPVRYGSSSDIQLWNLTNLAVQFRLSQLRRP